MSPIIVLVVGIVIAVAICLLVFKFRGMFRPKVNITSSKAIRQMWVGAERQTDALRKVMESAAILDRTMQELGWKGSLGDKLKKGGSYVPELNAVWRAVKLRNTLAHEPGTSVTPQSANEAYTALKHASEAFLR